MLLLSSSAPFSQNRLDPIIQSVKCEISLENYEANCQVFCDISKAFDRVWHRGLLHKLEKYGIKGELLLWIESYLNSRKQKVFVNGVLSS